MGGTEPIDEDVILGHNVYLIQGDRWPPAEKLSDLLNCIRETNPYDGDYVVFVVGSITVARPSIHPQDPGWDDVRAEVLKEWGS